MEPPTGRRLVLNLLIWTAFIQYLPVQIFCSECGTPPHDANANLGEITYGIGDVEGQDLSYTCRPGYVKFSDKETAGSNSYTRKCTEAPSSWSWVSGIADEYCVDYDECADPQYCAKGYCVNVPGSYVCVCDGVSNNIWDKDTLDCLNYKCGAPPVDAFAIRTQSEGEPDATVTFTCEPGFGVNGDPSRMDYNYDCDGGDGVWNTPSANTCSDIDECNVNGGVLHNCDPHATCVNTHGSFICRCNVGFTGSGISCSRIECPQLPSLLNADVVQGDSPNLNGPNHYGDVFIYACEPGHVVWYENLPWEKPDGFLEYHDIDLNQDEDFRVVCTSTGQYAPHPLPYCVPATCGTPGVIPHSSRTGGSDFTANGNIVFECDPGYKRTDGNTGPFKATCVPGVGWTGLTTCVNIDECSTSSTNDCHSAADCIDNPGSYQCTCRKGYFGNGFGPDGCSKVTCPSLTLLPYATMTTAPHENEYEDQVVYTCIQGFEVSVLGALHHYVHDLYGFSTTSFTVQCLHTGSWSVWPLPYCKPVDCGDPGLNVNASRTGGHYTYNSEVTYTCNKGYKLKAEAPDPQAYTITCRSDADWSSQQECVDINECTEKKHRCDHNADCFNVPGAYICRCKDGFTGDGFTCAETIHLPVYTPCEIVSSLRLCIHGDCVEQNNKAVCKCDYGYHGVACDAHIFGPAMIIAIAALCIGITLLFADFCCSCYYTHAIRRLRKRIPLPYPPTAPITKYDHPVMNKPRDVGNGADFGTRRVYGLRRGGGYAPPGVSPFRH